MMEFDLEDPLTGGAAGEWVEEEGGGAAEHYRLDSVAALFAAESDHHMPPLKTFIPDASLRRDAVSLLLQAQYSCNVDPLVTYLATNYIDRFLSRQEIPREKPWVVRLLALACFSLAAKMKKADFSAADFQGEEGFIYDAQTIRRAELLVLGALGWRMRSITPFSFLRFFLSLLRPRMEAPLVAALKSRAAHIVFRAQNELKLLEYKPSVVAAAALLTAAHELFPVQFPSFRHSISSCSYVHKEEEVWECCDVMGDVMATTDGCDLALEMVSSSCDDTPVTVLRHRHRHCSSSESDRAVGSRDPIKKRRVGGGGCGGDDD